MNRVLAPWVVGSLLASLSAQRTWIVDSMGGPGVDFTDLPAAVGAASAGDRIEVRPGAPGLVYTGFTTNRGLTVLGIGGAIQLLPSPTITVSGLPAGEQFRLAGFTTLRGHELRIAVTACAGQVHLENLHALEPGFFMPPTPSVLIADSPLVTMRDVETFGSPAVRIERSRAVLANCRLGLSSIGLGAGTGLEAIDATVSISEPIFRTGITVPAIVGTRSAIRIGGSTAGLVAAGDAQWGVPGTPIIANGGTITVDPNVQLQASPSSAPAITGTATVVFAPEPATWTSAAHPGQAMTVQASAPIGAAVVGILGLPAAPFALPIGELELQMAPLATWFVGTTGANGAFSGSVPLTTTLPRGLAFAVQPAVALAGNIRLGMPCTFVTH
ncbi:MAG: hypothetical protein IPK26_00455 [Planctomycetes bacterium]|nr:hypothetical protein [Planctomycetota bacterium]